MNLTNQKSPSDQKVVYLLVSAASKIYLLSELIEGLISMGLKVFVIPTPSLAKNLDILRLKSKKNVKVLEPEYQLSILSKKSKSIPNEDIVVFAPCTFNSVSKIASGIADSYALTLVANAISKRTPVLIAPSYSDLWQHPVNKANIDKLTSWGVKVLLPDMDGNLMTMTPVGKILDTIHSTILSKIKYNPSQLEGKDYQQLYEDIVINNLLSFQEVGLFAEEDGLNNLTHGCMSIRVSDDLMLITSSGAKLSNLSTKDLSLVHIPYSLKSKNVHWYGDNVPSSETPLHMGVYSHFPDAKAVVHTHCSEITYNSKYRQCKTDEYIPYGLPQTADALRPIMQENDGFAIMRLHGEVAYATSLEKAYAKIRSFLPENSKLRI